jgi:catechol 2,3-dioxygenase-like lactoylglutathione lyase family enzyme
MIERQSHTTVYVLNQDEALAFYRDKLSFEVRMDSTMPNGFRWLTVGPKAQPDLQIVLMQINEGPMWTKETVEKLKALVKQGTFGLGVFETPDCQTTYETLKAKGVEFLQPPTERFYGIEAIVKDNSGNWFSLTQRPKKTER